MKKIRHKVFYLYSFIIYLILAFIAFVLSTMYLEPDVRNYLVSTFSAHVQSNPKTLEVIVDDESLVKYPNWKSSMYVEILDYFHTYAKPKVIGLDFFKPNNPDYEKLLSKMDNAVAIFVPKSGFSASAEDEVRFMKEFKEKHALKVNKSIEIDKPTMTGISEYSDVDNLGSAVIKLDESANKIFSAINILKVEDAYYPSLALKMYLLVNDTNEIEINKDYTYVPKTGLKIPHSEIKEGMISNNIRFYLPFMQKNGDKILKSDAAHPYIAAYKIIESYRHLKYEGKLHPDDINPDIFTDLNVFIGINQSGPYQDILVTPMAERHPGVDIQATIFDNLVCAEFLYDASPLVNFLITFFLSLITFIFVLRLKFGKSLAALVVIDALFCLAAMFFAYSYYIINMSGALTVQLITLIFGYSFKFITENRNKEKIKLAMGKYLSQDIMKNVVSNIDDLGLGGKRAVVTVLFSDIRGFTSMSEKMSAEEVSLILNEYFAEMEPIISKYNGVINKFIGDAVMAIFGEPIQDVNHAQNAVRCAYEMLKKVEYLREKWLFEGKPKFEIGVGINTGEVFIGNIGTENRMEYTVIGDTVNLASRIESYNKVYKTNLLVSSSTYEYIAGIADVIKINEVQIRGKSKKMNIYEVLRIDKG